MTSPLVPLPHHFPWYQGGVYILQHIIGVTTTSLPHNIFYKRANNRCGSFFRVLDREGGKG